MKLIDEQIENFFKKLNTQLFQISIDDKLIYFIKINKNKINEKFIIVLLNEYIKHHPNPVKIMDNESYILKIDELSSSDLRLIEKENLIKEFWKNILIEKITGTGFQLKNNYKYLAIKYKKHISYLPKAFYKNFIEKIKTKF